MGGRSHLLPLLLEDRLGGTDIADLGEIPSKKSSVRGGRLHPEERARRIAQKAAETSARLPAGWRFRYGFVVFLRTPSGVTHRRDTRMNGSYEDAVALRDREMRTGRYESAWLKEKTEENG